MNSKAQENRRKIEQIKTNLDCGLITYDEAKELAQPIIDSINERSKEIAKKFGVKPKYVNFTMLLR